MSQAQDVRELTYQSLLAPVFFQLSTIGAVAVALVSRRACLPSRGSLTWRRWGLFLCIVCEPGPVVRVRVRGSVVRIRVHETAIRIRIVVRTANDPAVETFRRAY